MNAGASYRSIRTLLAIETLTYVYAALVHRGVLMDGYQHPRAFIAESIIAAVLAMGFAVASARPAATRRAAIFSQGFALVGTLVGLFTIAVGVGPRTVPDVVYHIAIVCVLIYGLVMARASLE